ncbi:hypothetical protein MNBD_PLANCTO02-2936 [hydrothermal vent metagenome]|uniref:OstA-like protein n=1 Tax=hydrothermal vent metagenome TaxID=652676 RepID=A0A3B1DDT2_9ZZZZ
MSRPSQSPSIFSSRWFLTVVVAAGMSGMFYCYSLAMRPLLKSPLETKAIHAVGWQPPINRPRENREIAIEHLSEQSWAADAKYQLRNKETYIYTNEWEQIEDGQAIRFHPFAMVIKSKNGKRPLTVVAESAYVRFQSKFSPTTPNPGKIISGALQGAVHIKGADGLVLDGRNFSFSESAQRIWSDHNVSFAFQEHYGKAMGIELELIPDKNPKKGSMLEVVGIRSIRLRRNVDMHLQTDTKKTDSVKPSTMKGVAEIAKHQSRMVQIRSAGSFDFSSTDNTAAFLQDVQVFQLTGQNQYDSLRCDRLTLFFKEKKKPLKKQHKNLQVVASEKNLPEKKASERKRRFQGISSNLEFQRLVAEGKNVLLISQKNDLKAKMNELIYDSTTRVVQLLHSKNVEVLQGLSQMRSPKITLLNDEKNRVQSVLCDGAGQMEHYDKKTGKLQFAVQWKEQLKKFPDAKSDLDIIELKKDVLLREPPRMMGLAANYMRLWVNRQATSSNRQSTERQSELRPQRILAIDNVAMLSPEMQAETDRLEIWFEQRETLPVAKEDSQQTNQQKQNKRTSPLFSPEEQPGNSANNNDKTLQTTKEPIQIDSKLIRVRVLRTKDGKQSQVAEVWAEGKVKVTQEHEGKEKPLSISGRRMHVVNHSEKSQNITIYGKPAHIFDRGMHMEGDEVHLDRKNNKAWIEGAGLLELPIERSLEGEKLKKTEMLDVLWKEKMVFDGQTANFYGDVSTEMDDSRLLCQHMEVQLTNRISFSETANSKERQKTEIKNIICQDGVKVKSREYLKNKLQSLREAGFWKLTVNQLTGKSIAEGPGWITVWRRGDGKPMRTSAIRTVQANQPVKTKKRKKWEYLRVDFSGKTSGNMKDRFTTFRNRVRVVYGPVDKPGVVIDSDKLPENAGWMRCKTLQLTQHEKTKTKKAYLEMVARGNAELDGNEFHARADSISFDESKDLYVLRSIGKQKATIWRQTNIAGDYSRADAQRMEFIPSRNKLKLDRTTGLQGVQ